MSIQVAAPAGGAAAVQVQEFHLQEHPAVRKAAAPPRENARRKSVESSAADLERVSFALNRKLRFMVDYKSHEVTVKVIDPETDKVIKILPPEELQRLHSRIQETIGFFFDERA
ncbi:MAG: flagellar protein FlaG [Treponema sp.]|jgi:flagellar protein FlaG|nr:flagellar protein FlaG [Treponema sp.]